LLLKKRFLIRKHKVCDALQWLVRNHEDYQRNVTINVRSMEGHLRCRRIA
jgi:hypothetical protein